jgi:uncharacterized membrane protein YphA (DoxX/SURF4 family)
MKRSVPVSTAIFLVLLRLVIGWHFLAEGWHKVESTWIIGETPTNKPFSSAGYFREAPGPFAWLVRQQVGDLDDQALDELTPQEPPYADESYDWKPHESTPAAIDKEWRAYVERFKQHYQLDDYQKALADAKLEQAEEQLVLWLVYGQDDVKKTFPTGTVEEKEKTSKRIAEYRAKVKELRDTAERKLPAMGRDVEKARLAALKKEVADLRAGLLADLAAKADDPAAGPTKAASATALSASPGAGPYLSASELIGGRTDLKKSLDDLLTPEQRKLGPVPEVPVPNPLYWVDRVTEILLLVVGACLVLGLFTRTNCLLGAAFLLLTYLAVPPFPWLPTPPNTEGFYFFVNKNLIEMVALLALATTRSGRWFGVDAWLAALWRAWFGRRQPAPADAGRREAA